MSSSLLNVEDSEEQIPEEDVYLCFGAWDNLRSRFVRWATKSEWSHVWIEYNSERWGGRMVVHSDSKGVMVEPLRNFYERRGVPTSSVIYKVVKGDPTLGFIRSRQYLGRGYGYFTVLINLIFLWMWRLGFKKMRGVRDVGKYICSELGVLFIKNSDIPCDLDAELTWPGLLESWINSQSLYFKKFYEGNVCLGE